MSWPTKKLGEVTIPQYGCAFPSDDFNEDGLGVPVIRIGDVAKGSTERFYAGEYNPQYLVNPGESLVTLSGTLTVSKWDGPQALLNQRIAVLRDFNPEILPDFVTYQLPSALSEIESKISEGTIKNVLKSHLESLEIKVPDLKTQQKIVERLDAIRKAQELNEKQISLTDELFQSLIHQELKPREGWETKKLAQIFRRVKDFVLPKTHSNKEFNFIGLENIESNTGYLVNFKPTKGILIKSTKAKFLKSDTLFGKLRPYLNKVWFAEFDGVCSTDIWVLRPVTSEVLPELLPVLLRRPAIIEKSSTTMTGSSLPRANRGIFDNLKIPLPPLKTQHQIVQKLSAVQDYKKKLLHQKELLQELFDSTLDKAMKGELVK